MTERNRDLVGKKITVFLKNNRKYSGVIKEVDENTIYLIDKFGQLVIFNFNEISSMEVDNE